MGESDTPPGGPARIFFCFERAIQDRLFEIRSGVNTSRGVFRGGVSLQRSPKAIFESGYTYVHRGFQVKYFEGTGEVCDSDTAQRVEREKLGLNSNTCQKRE